ncbi:MAG: sensor histidine kinase [Spirochaetales bacterium]|nr:sensor histidine kinase [Spirochaetales bacterium]
MNEKKSGKTYSKGALTISFIYFVFGTLWIFFSDNILEKMSPDMEFYARVQTYKGWFYVVITTLLIFSLLKVYISRKNKAIYQLTIKETELEKELEEKEALLKEVHHRVKNNLQTLTSLITLRSGSLTENMGEFQVEKIIEQIHSLSLIYDKVYQEDQPSRSNMKAYIHDMASYLQTCSPNSDKVVIKYDIEDITVSIDQAVSFGIILNEILSNSFRHAFPDVIEGIIKIKFHQNDKINYLQIEDNGKGFNPGIVNPGIVNNGFGFELIEMLTLQLNGKLKISSKPGSTKIQLNFS